MVATSKLGLLYINIITAKIAGYTDADWAGDIGDRKSTSGYMILLQSVGRATSRPMYIALSTTEAKHVACLLLH